MRPFSRDIGAGRKYAGQIRPTCIPSHPSNRTATPGVFQQPPLAGEAASGFRRCGNTRGGARFWQRREGAKRRNGSFPRPAVSPGRNRALASSGPGSRRRDSPGVMSGADSIQPPGAMSQRPGSRARICPQLPLEGFGWAILPVCGFERESSSPGSASPSGAGSRRSGSEGVFAARKLARAPSFSRIGLRRESVSPPGSEFPNNSIKSDKFPMFFDKYVKIHEWLTD